MGPSRPPCYTAAALLHRGRRWFWRLVQESDLKHTSFPIRSRLRSGTSRKLNIGGFLAWIPSTSCALRALHASPGLRLPCCVGRRDPTRGAATRTTIAIALPYHCAMPWHAKCHARPPRRCHGRKNNVLSADPSGPYGGNSTATRLLRGQVGRTGRKVTVVIGPLASPQHG